MFSTFKGENLKEDFIQFLIIASNLNKVDINFVSKLEKE